MYKIYKKKLIEGLYVMRNKFFYNIHIIYCVENIIENMKFVIEYLYHVKNGIGDNLINSI